MVERKNNIFLDRIVKYCLNLQPFLVFFQLESPSRTSAVTVVPKVECCTMTERLATQVCCCVLKQESWPTFLRMNVSGCWLVVRGAICRTIASVNVKEQVQCKVLWLPQETLYKSKPILIVRCQLKPFSSPSFAPSCQLALAWQQHEQTNLWHSRDKTVQ